MNKCSVIIPALAPRLLILMAWVIDDGNAINIRNAEYRTSNTQRYCSYGIVKCLCH